MISESTINKVRILPIEDILKPYVKLSRKGLTLMGLCPFHSERTGSFAVTPSKNCFIVSVATVEGTASLLSWRRRT